jgi:hypothetical protein
VVLGIGAGAFLVLRPSRVADEAETPPTPQSVPLPQSMPEVVVPAPKVKLTKPDRASLTPKPLTRSKDLERVYTVLHEVVKTHAMDPGDPWAVAHGVLALGPSEKLTNGADAIDWLFDHYAKVVTIAGEDLVEFPPSDGAIRIEPHTDLLLKMITESGQEPDRLVRVAGREFPLSALYRTSLRDAWVVGPMTGFQDQGFNDTPWALQGLSAWAQRGLVWTAVGGRKMTLDGFTHHAAANLVHESRGLTEAKAKGELVKKDTRNGIFRYTCGGQHLLQGVAYAVARGFGSPGDQVVVCEQLDLLVWRIDVELGAIDPMIPTATRPIQIVLLEQRLKFLGHFLETMHRILGTGMCPVNDSHVAASERVATELVRTVDALSGLGVWSDLAAVRNDHTLDQYRNGGAEQVYLDFVGDSAHAVRGIDLATGRARLVY